MSTKTTIKRVALVAAVALTLGGFSAVSASADSRSEGTAAGIYIDAATSNGDGGLAGVAGVGNSLIVNIQQAVDTPTNTQFGAYVTISGTAGSTIVAAYETTSAVTVETSTIGTAAPATGAVTISADGKSAYLAGGTTSYRALRLSTPVAGSIVVSVFNGATSGANPSRYNQGTANATATITVNATAVTGTLSLDKTTFYDTTTVGATATASLTTTPVVIATAGSRQVTYTAAFNDANGVALPSTTAWSVTMTGPGTLASGAGTSSTSGARVLSGQGSTAAFSIFGDGSSGSSVVTLSVGTKVIGSKNVSFYSTTVASLAATTKYSVAYGTASGFTAKANAVYVTAKDANGNAIPSAPSGLTVTSSDKTVATAVVGAYSADAGGTGVGGTLITVTGVAAGKATLTIADSTGLIKATTDVVVTTPVAASVSLATDAAAYEPGAKVTLTYTAANAAGAAIADGDYVLFLGTKPTTNVSVQGTVDSTTLTFVGGKATATFYAPLSAGSVLVTGGVLGTSASLATALQGTTIADTTFVVNGSADSALAVDAANAATDAANAAAEEASNATEAASEALAAVNSLATTVASLIAGIKAQLTSLTALIKKIQAKVKA